MSIKQAFKYLILISKIEMVSWMMIYIISTCISIIFNILIYKELKRIKQPLRRGSKLPGAGSNPHGEHEPPAQSSKVNSPHKNESLVHSDKANTNGVNEMFLQSGRGNLHEEETLLYADANTQTEDMNMRISALSAGGHSTSHAETEEEEGKLLASSVNVNVNTTAAYENKNTVMQLAQGCSHASATNEATIRCCSCQSRCQQHHHAPCSR